MAKARSSNQNRWSVEDIEYLKKNYGIIPTRQIAECLGRSYEAVNTYCVKHKIKNHTRYWTEEEIQFINDNYSSMTPKEVAEVLKRSERSVITYASKHNIPAKSRWTEEEMDYLEGHYGFYTPEQIGNILGKTKAGVQSKALRMTLGAFHEQGTHVTIAEANRLIGIGRRTFYKLEKSGLIKIRRRSRFALIRLDDLIEFMKTHPELYKASECDKSFFENMPWFHEKLLEERKEADAKYRKIG